MQLQFRQLQFRQLQLPEEDYQNVIKTLQIKFCQLPWMSKINRWNIIKAHGDTVKEYITFWGFREGRWVPSYCILMSLQVELFNAIHWNGYYLIYLSARAIGQAGYTKEFLRKVRRGKASLPVGPLFLAPFSLYTAFKRSVTYKLDFFVIVTCMLHAWLISEPHLAEKRRQA